MDASNITGMNHAAVWALIEPQLKRLGITPHAASKKAGVPEAIRNIKRGLGGTTYRALEKLAPVVDIPVEKLWAAANSRTAAPVPEGIGIQRIRDKADRLRAQIAELEAELQGYERSIALMEQPQGPEETPAKPPKSRRSKNR